MSEMMKNTFATGLIKASGLGLLHFGLLAPLGCAGGVPMDPPDAGQVDIRAEAVDAAADPGNVDASLADGGSGPAPESNGGVVDGNLVASDSPSSDPRPAGGDPNTNPSEDACPPQAFGPEEEGCTMTLRTPANCAAIRLSEEFAWEADACHTPYYLQVTGNPPDENNYNEIYIDAYINALAWAEPFSMEFVEGLRSTDGWYHWRICNAYLSGCSATRAFRME